MSGLSLGNRERDLSKARTTPSPPPHLSEQESKYYYAGLYSRPVLIARTGTTPWEAPTGLEAYTRPKVLRIVGNHEIKDVWEDDLALKVHAILEQKGVDWTSTDVVRIGYADEPSGNVVLWIGAKPDSVSYPVAIDAVFACRGLLLDHGIVDVDVEMRESEVTRYAGPPLLRPAFNTDPKVDVCMPFTDALSIPICAELTPWAEGTSGFFLEEEGGDGKRLLLVTVRHVVFPQSENEPFERKSAASQKRHNVLVLSETSFQQHLVSVDDNIDAQNILIGYQSRRLEQIEGEDDLAEAEREDARNELKKAEKKVEGLTTFRKELSKHWSTDESRILGHVIFSPPIILSAGPDEYTQDVAVIEIDPSKIDPGSFRGNVIDLGSKYAPQVLTTMMHPNPKNPRSFVFPGNRLLSLRGTIPDNEMRKPTMYDRNDERCIMVIKSGRSTGVTVGRASNIFSYTRIASGNITGVSKEWAILPFDNKSGPFSGKGDSGAAVVDGRGRIGGLLTGGAGPTETPDITYVTPISFVMNIIRSNKSLANSYPKAGPPD
ncbi:hypothetical protein DFH94DRAFT_767632 [Russula ochroleuca]|jgi:hypothetical protein|uniref:Uncharacterized protein n=1 Tax=Russula ochroleuca TaxID=152965 RepID=A0A9P5MQ89_9AGAM|nr:hypothetical protein DFH94DRAFT_767632 [Russula ochroleuca]